MNDRYLIYGAGGHGRVVLDILRAGGVPAADIFFVDDKAGGNVYGIEILRARQIRERKGYGYVVAVGDNAARKRLSESLEATTHFRRNVIHPTASISPYAKLGLGIVVCAQANIGPGAEVGDGAIINTGANVDHDCRVGAFTHIAPHATLCGGVYVGDLAFVGAGATCLPGAFIGAHAIVGAQGLVKEKAHVSPHTTVVGVPARERLKA